MVHARIILLSSLLLEVSCGGTKKLESEVVWYGSDSDLCNGTPPMSVPTSGRMGDVFQESYIPKPSLAAGQRALVRSVSNVEGRRFPRVMPLLPVALFKVYESRDIERVIQHETSMFGTMSVEKGEYNWGGGRERVVRYEL